MKKNDALTFKTLISDCLINLLAMLILSKYFFKVDVYSVLIVFAGISLLATFLFIKKNQLFINFYNLFLCSFIIILVLYGFLISRTTELYYVAVIIPVIIGVNLLDYIKKRR